MAFIPVPQTAELVIKQSCGGEPVYNILNVFSDAPITQARLEQLATVTLQGWGDGIMPQLSVELTLVEVVARDLSEQDSLQATESYTTPLPGSIGGDVHPNNVALVMTHRTGRIGRSRRGRTYFGGIPETRTTGNNASTGLTDDLLGAFTVLRSDWVTLGWQFVVVSRQANGVPRGTGLTTIVTQSLFRNQTLDTQRRRLPQG